MLPWMMLLTLATAGAAPVPEIHWQFGPRTLMLAGVGALSLPRGMISADRGEARRFLEATVALEKATLCNADGRPVAQRQGDARRSRQEPRLRAVVEALRARSGGPL